MIKRIRNKTKNMSIINTNEEKKDGPSSGSRGAGFNNSSVDQFHDMKGGPEKKASFLSSNNNDYQDKPSYQREDSSVALNKGKDKNSPAGENRTGRQISMDSKQRSPRESNDENKSEVETTTV